MSECTFDDEGGKPNGDWPGSECTAKVGTGYCGGARVGVGVRVILGIGYPGRWRKGGKEESNVQCGKMRVVFDDVVVIV